MPPLEGRKTERADNDNEAQSNVQVMSWEPVVSEEVDVEDVLSEEESGGESSSKSPIPLLEDRVEWPQPASFPVVNATTRPNDICPWLIRW